MSRERSHGALWCVLLVAGCQPSGEQGASLDDIIAAHYQAIKSGQYDTQMRPFLHPRVAHLADAHPFLKDLSLEDESSAPKSGDKSSHTLREITQADRDLLLQYFELPLEPTHVAEFTTVGTQDDASWTAVEPLHLLKSDDWFVVIGALTQEPELEIK